MTEITKHYDNLCKLVQNSLSMAPNNKKQSINMDNLKSHSGYIQHTIIKNNPIFDIDCGPREKTSSVTIDSNNIVNEYNVPDTEYKKKMYENIHNEAQHEISYIVSDLKDLIKKYPNKYQSQLAEEAGLTKVKLNDNNFTVATFFQMMVDQDIITKRKEGSNVFFSIKNDKPYQPIPYIQPNGYASKLEATVAQYLLDNNINFKQQVKLPNLGLLRMDFEALIDENPLYIEVDGKQHYEWVKRFHKTEDEFLEQQKRDNKKTQYCLENDLDFLRIKYDENIPQKISQKIYDLRNQ